MFVWIEFLPSSVHNCNNYHWLIFQIALDRGYVLIFTPTVWISFRIKLYVLEYLEGNSRDMMGEATKVVKLLTLTRNNLRQRLFIGSGRNRFIQFMWNYSSVCPLYVLVCFPNKPWTEWNTRAFLKISDGL